MPWNAWFALSVVLLNVALLIFTRIGADIVLVAGVSLLLLAGILSPEEALAGLANEGMVTVGVLYVVVAGLSETGGVNWLGARLFGRPRSLLGGQVRLMAPIALMSAFLNNTPLVAMMIPAVDDWAKRQNFAPSKLMLPLSYAAIFGGTCSLIGASTNLVVNGLLIAQTDTRLGLFEIAWVGVPCALVGILYVLTLGRWLLPNRQGVIAQGGDVREYTLEMIVEPSGPLPGKSIEAAGLRQLPGLYLAEIDRAGRIIPAVSPQKTLLGGDRLLFVGVVESVVDLQKIRGLTPAPEQLFKLSTPRPQRILVEVVVSNSSPVVGKSVREGRFRTLYNAVIIAVARGGERLRGKVGDIVLQPGDTLLLEAPPSFAQTQRNARDFFLVSRVENSSPPRHERSILALSILASMVTVVAFGWLSMLEAAVLAAGLMLITRCVSGATARRGLASVDRHRGVVRSRASLRGYGCSREYCAELGAACRWERAPELGGHLRHHDPLYRDDYQQRRSGLDVSHRVSYCHELRRRHHPVRHRHHDGSLGEFRHADRLSNQPDGVWSRRLPLHRLSQGRRDDSSGTVFEEHHQPLEVWILCLYLMGLNLSNQQRSL